MTRAKYNNCAVEVFIFNPAVLQNIRQLDSDINILPLIDKGRGEKKKSSERFSAFKFIQTLSLTVMNVTLYSTICLMHRPVKFSIPVQRNGVTSIVYQIPRNITRATTWIYQSISACMFSCRLCIWWLMVGLKDTLLKQSMQINL